MDKYLTASSRTQSHIPQMSTRSSARTPLTASASTKTKPAIPPTNKRQPHMTHTSATPENIFSSPELLTGDADTPPNLSPQHSPPDPLAPDTMQAAAVAQEVTRLLIPIFDKRFDILQTSINSALTQITTNSQRIEELETRVAACESSLTTLTQDFDHQRQTENALRDKLDDLENRERRNNLRFVGIPENITGDNLLAFLTTDLMPSLQLPAPPDPLLIERFHRIGPPRDQAGNRPRPVIARYLNWTVKEQVLRAYRKAGTLLVKSIKVLIFQDFSVSVTQKRKAFTPICKYLHDHATRFQLLYPAKLRVQDNGRTHTFDNPSEARRHFHLPED